MHCIALNTMQFLQGDPSTEYIDIRCDDNDVIKSVMSACTFMIGGGGGGGGKQREVYHWKLWGIYTVSHCLYIKILPSLQDAGEQN